MAFRRAGMTDGCEMLMRFDISRMRSEFKVDFWLRTYYQLSYLEERSVWRSRLKDECFERD